MNYKDAKPVYVSSETLKAFKIYCIENDTKMGDTLDKILSEYLENQEK